MSTYYMHRSSRLPGCWDIRRDSLLGDSGLAEDTLRTRAAAEYALSLLNRGLATVDRTRTLGCRITPVYRDSIREGARILAERVAAHEYQRATVRELAA